MTELIIYSKNGDIIASYDLEKLFAENMPIYNEEYEDVDLVIS